MIDPIDAVDAMINMYKSLKRFNAKRKVKREIKRNQRGIDDFLVNITSANHSLELIPECRDYPQLGFRQKFFGDAAYNPLVQMYSINFRWQTVFGFNFNPMIIRESSFFFYPQDFLTLYKDLKLKKHCAVGFYGFKLTQERDFYPESHTKTVRTVERGIIGGRITLNGSDFFLRKKNQKSKGTHQKSDENNRGFNNTQLNNEYMLDARPRECGLEISQVDLPEFKIESSCQIPFDDVYNYIKRNKHAEKYRIFKD
jgi:hypothetical protein